MKKIKRLWEKFRDWQLLLEIRDAGGIYFVGYNGCSVAWHNPPGFNYFLTQDETDRVIRLRNENRIQRTDRIHSTVGDRRGETFIKHQIFDYVKN